MNPITPQQASSVKSILTRLAAPDAVARALALADVRGLDTWAIPLLADEIASPDPITSKAAKRALETLTHHLLTPRPGKDRPDGKTQTRLADALADAAESGRPRPARACALALLGFAGGKPHEKRLERLETDPAIGDDARMARARLKTARY